MKHLGVRKEGRRVYNAINAVPLRHYFKKEVGLTDEQIELVLGIARRVAHDLEDSSRQR